ncbi:MAG: bifunctional (p)ppGpp synthetase/guanosine-3',5'-bis(diphosphate) 3'-pyrophosphohydrolase [Clostridia bacterium]|nr:bifunctional (p)ppGpp synthetase/guanosine-3',5'-bis(diphosphate) 3'-pyrophosphohydrolase [Clostridia bacterium]
MKKAFGELIEKIKKYNPNSNFELIESAYNVAKKYHEGQVRLSGEPFLNHPIEVAKILADLELNSKTIAAGLMHDVIEDTDADYNEIKELFGEEIADMVEGVSKLSKLALDTRKEQQVENLRKMLMAMSKDIRVIIIKLSDRLHNMRTLAHVSREKQIEKATETMEIYAPISHRLGMSAFKWELEDLSFRYLYPEEYRNLVTQIAVKRKEREKYIDDIIVEIKENLKEKNIEGIIDGRVKHLYSIYSKMKRQNTTIEQIFDMFAVRIIVDNIKDCYAALGMVHEMFRPVPGRFKDYIAMPKPNMYQSLHTTLVGKQGHPFEVQIRTHDMHRIAEYGIAAHWKYKQGISRADDIENKLAWLRQMIEWQKDTADVDEFYDNLKIDLFDDEVFVFSPKGDVINLPAGSTPIDFAYSIHSAIGNKMTGAKINGKMVPISYVLENGDIVEIITLSSSKGPSRDWLKIVKSTQAKNKIRQYFKKEHRDENIEKGREMIEHELKRQGLSFQELFKPEYYEDMLKRYNFKTLDDALGAVGYSGITSNKIISKLKEAYRKANPDDPALKDKELQQKDKAAPVTTTDERGIIVRGINNCLVTIGKCCNPVPGDDIIGYITRGRGVTIHRRDCVNVINDPKFKEREIDVRWAEKTSADYQSEIVIKAHDRNNLLNEITNVLHDSSISLTSVEGKANKEGYAIIKLQMGILNKDQLSTVIKRLKRLSGVIDINRSNRKAGKR